MTEDQINLCREAFSKSDSNQDGFIDSEQMKQAFRLLGFSGVTDQQVNQYIRDLDENNTGEIGFSEFLSIMSFKMKDMDTQMGTKEAFRFFDKQNTGKIGRHQLKMVIMNVGSNPGMKESEAEELLTEIDTDLIDERGMIDYE